MAKQEQNLPMIIKIEGIKAVRVVPFGQEVAVIKKAGEEVEVRRADGNYLVALNRAVEVKPSKAEKK